MWYPQTKGITPANDFTPQHRCVCFPVSDVTNREEAPVPPSVPPPVDPTPPPASFSTNTHLPSTDSAQVKHTQASEMGGVCYHHTNRILVRRGSVWLDGRGSIGYLIINDPKLYVLL